MNIDVPGLRLLRRAVAAAAVVAGLLTLLASAGATAAWEPGALPVSLRGTDLGDRDSSTPLLAGGGRYVVFATTSPLLLGRPAAAGEYFGSGWVRKDLTSGAIDLVATPERRLVSDGGLVAEGVAETVAGVSDDGRYVLLGSRVPLCCGVTSTITQEVYVRDMTRPRSDPSGYELVSARDGASGPADYADRRSGSTPSLRGSQVTRGSALSDDGRRALFVTQTESSLPSEPGVSTPRWQLLVRDLDARTTRLVTRERGDVSLHGTPVAPARTDDGAPLALLSGDGGAVVWAGGQAARQARFLPGETTGPTSDLLWRELDAGPAAPTRRVAGAADPDDPACPADAVFVPSVTDTGPCYGPFAEPEEQTPTEPTPPRPIGISDDGRRVLFEASAMLRPFSQPAHRPGSAYLADMSANVPRKQAVTVAWSRPPTRREIASGTLAGDGRHAAFASADNVFDSLRPIGSFQAGDLLTPNLFAVDLDDRTVERATVAPDGADYALEQPASSGLTGPSISDDGSRIALGIADGNLFVGDANGADDVMILRRAERTGAERRRDLPAPPPPPVVVEPPLQQPAPVHAAVGRVQVGAGGVATVSVRVPTAGTLTAEASGRQVALRARRTSGRGARRAVASAPRPVRVGRTRRVLRRGPATVRLRIAPSRAARRALRATPGRRLDVRLTIRFAATAGSTRSDQRYVLDPQPAARRGRAVPRGTRR